MVLKGTASLVSSILKHYGIFFMGKYTHTGERERGENKPHVQVPTCHHPAATELHSFWSVGCAPFQPDIPLDALTGRYADIKVH